MTLYALNNAFKVSRFRIIPLLNISKKCLIHGKNHSSISRSHVLTQNLKVLNHCLCNKLTTQTDIMYEKVCEETLESLTEFFEELVESNSIFSKGDVTYSDGVLTVNLGEEFGIYVINRQSPNKQIWLSSPISGPKRYDYNEEGEFWIYKHDSQSLHSLLQEEISKILGKKIDLSRCSYFK